MTSLHALTVPADTPSLSVVSAFVWAVALEAGLDNSGAYRIRLAVDEVVTNIMVHGYGEEEDGTIRMWAEYDEDELSFTITDTSTPFDITAAEEPQDMNLPPEERNLGGLGVFLVTHYVDYVRYERIQGYNITRLTVKCR